MLLPGVRRRPEKAARDGAGDEDLLHGADRVVCGAGDPAVLPDQQLAVFLQLLQPVHQLSGLLGPGVRLRVTISGSNASGPRLCTD